MPVKEMFGKKIICNHYFSIAEIPIGSSWLSYGGTVAVVEDTSNGYISYHTEYEPSKTFEVEHILFQSKYCKIIS